MQTQLTDKQKIVAKIVKARTKNPDGPSVAELCEELGVSSVYFYKQRDKVGVVPRKKRQALAVITPDYSVPQTIQLPAPHSAMPSGMSVVIMVPTDRLAQFFKGVMQ